MNLEKQPTTPLTEEEGRRENTTDPRRENEMKEGIITEATRLADDVLKEQMKKSGYKVYEGSGGGQEYIRAVAALAVGILETDTNKEHAAGAVSLADDVLKEQMKKSGYKVYEGSGGGQVYIVAVAILAAGILTTNAKQRS